MSDKLQRASLICSCTRAFLDRIDNNVRLVACRADSNKITVRVITFDPPSEQQIEMIQDATTEIVADFVDATISEMIESSRGLLKTKGDLGGILIFRRYESES